MIRREHDWSSDHDAKAFKERSELRLLQEEHAALGVLAQAEFTASGRGCLMLSPSYSVADLQGESAVASYLLDYLTEAEQRQTAKTAESRTAIVDELLIAIQTYEPTREFLVSFLEGGGFRTLYHVSHSTG